MGTNTNRHNRENVQLEWHSIESWNPSSSFDIKNTVISTSQQYYQNQPQYDANLPENHVEKHISMSPVTNQWYSPYQ